MADKATGSPKTLALYDYAKQQRIPGGTQLLSKRPEMFLPDQWPAYYARAKGCKVWDLDGREWIDMTTCGIGSCLLGYADPDVNAAVKATIDNGNMSTLNAPQEVELADLLCEIHPWADMVRYARTGGEAMAIAARLARAASGRDRIAFCGYHGWSDWYLAANLADDQALDGHLLPGLEPLGVPRALRGTALPFRYNHIDELEAIVAEHGDELGGIIMEPMRNGLPKDGFLHKVRDIATRTGAVMVIDEVSAGWRYHYGGMHLRLGVEPDVAVFAKSISNGYPMAAIVGRREVMQAAQVSFISSTYWTEAIGPTAALATLRKMREVNLPAHTERIGQVLLDGWQRLAAKHGLRLTHTGLPPLTHFALDYGDDSQALRTLFTQCMLDRGFLATSYVYATLAHTEAIADVYLAAADEAFAVVVEAADKGDVMKRLRGPVAHKGFQRLT